MVRTDRDMKERSKEMNKYLHGQNIHYYYALNTETKVNYSERLIKTFKHKLFKYIMKNIKQRL